MLVWRLALRTLLLAFLWGLPGSAFAQAPPAPSAPAAPPPAPAPPAAAPMPLTVMVVDVQALLQNSKSAKMVRSQIEQKRNEYTKEISHDEETLRAERDALQRQQASMSADALNQKGREFQQKVNDLERNVQGKRQALEKSNGEALSKIQEQMLKIIADIAKDRKANLVFQRVDLPNQRRNKGARSPGPSADGGPTLFCSSRTFDPGCAVRVEWGEIAAR